LYNKYVVNTVEVKATFTNTLATTGIIAGAFIDKFAGALTTY
jgi:hypothetical protein